MREVKRYAKVGEYIKIVNKAINETRYENGKIFKVQYTYTDGDVNVATENTHIILVLLKEYVVLEDYNPTEFHVGDRVQIKSWEEMEHVDGFIKSMKHLCGRTATIKSINDEAITLTDWSNEINTAWTYHINMVKKVNENVKTTTIVINKQDTLIEEGDNMNKVLELWKKRKLNKLEKEYEKGEKEYRENIDIVKKYNQLIENFEKDMQDLYIMDEEHKYIKQRNEPSFCPYYLDNEYISDEYRELKCEEYGNKEKEIQDIVEEVEAQLSLSNDLEYQKEVLTNYGILDKTTGKIKVD